MSSFAARTFSPAILSVAFFSSAALAQLLGCDAVGCPVDEYRTAKCEIGNATLKAIGIANITTTLDSQPFTWTLGLQEHETNDKQPKFDRNFYLGTPPPLQLNDTTGCALFFEGISANLTAPDSDQLDKFTCSDALAQGCISDLVAQAQSAVEEIGNATSGSSNFCNQLRDSLVDKPPSSCNGVTGSWGKVISQALTGDSAQAYSTQTTCHPTTGQDYNLALIASSRIEPSSREWSQLAPVLEAVTPVLSIFTKGNETDMELSCLRLVESRANQTIDNKPSEGLATQLKFTSTLYFTLMAMVFLVLLG